MILLIIILALAVNGNLGHIFYTAWDNEADSSLFRFEDRSFLYRLIAYQLWPLFFAGVFLLYWMFCLDD